LVAAGVGTNSWAVAFRTAAFGAGILGGLAFLAITVRRGGF
jgi:hypothetical protein